MKRIITQGQLLNKETPKPGSFRYIAEKIEELAPTIGQILGLTFVGSYVLNQHGRPSDLDIAIYFKGELTDLAIALRPIVKEAAKLFVPLNFILISDSEPSYTQKYQFSESFRKVIHYFETNGGSVVENVFEHVPTSLKGIQALHMFCAHKVKKISEDWMNFDALSEEEKHQFYAQILNAPINAVRQYLQWCKLPLAVSHGSGADILLGCFQEYSLRHMSVRTSEAQVKHLNNVLEIKNEYVTLLNDKNPDKLLKIYKSIITRTKDNLNGTLNFLKAISDSLV